MGSLAMAFLNWIPSWKKLSVKSLYSSGKFPEKTAGISQDQRCRSYPEEGQETPERLGKQAERTGRPESRNHPRHPGRECLGQRTAGHTGGRGKRGFGNSGKAACSGAGRIRRSHQNGKAQ